MAGLALLCSPAAVAGGDLSFFLGQNTLKDDPLDVSGVGSPTELGLLLNLDFGWPVVVAVDLLRGSEDTAQDVPAEFPLSLSTEVETLNLDVGARYFFCKDDALRPYVGGGVGWSRMDVKQTESGSFGPGTEYQLQVVGDTGSDVSVWVGAGLLYKLGRMQVGADARYTDASVEVTPTGSPEALGWTPPAFTWASSWGGLVRRQVGRAAPAGQRGGGEDLPTGGQGALHLGPRRYWRHGEGQARPRPSSHRPRPERGHQNGHVPPSAGAAGSWTPGPCLKNGHPRHEPHGGGVLKEAPSPCAAIPPTAAKGTP
jgi:opacity protein-like surface antigen